MIQHTNARQSSVAIAPLRQVVSDSPEQWGYWAGRKHYSLEVVQHPLRARMCGFGDKDRRPLAPAAVAKMVVRREDNSIVDVDDMDCSFFLVTVDLWSADGKHETNLVLHPSSADRFIPPHSSTKSRRGGTSSSAPLSRAPGNQPPSGGSTPTLSQHRPGEQRTPLPHPHASGYNNQGYVTPHAPQVNDALSFPSSTPYGPTQADPSWCYPPPPPGDRSNSFPHPTLPSIHTLGRNPLSSTSDHWNSEPEPQSLAYRAWNTDAPYHPSLSSYSNSQVDPSVRNHSNSEGLENSGWSSSEATSPHSQADHAYESTTYHHSAYHPAPTHSQMAPGTYPSQHISTVPSLPKHTYTRTLVGPLSANACRLLDEHRKAGIFFLFQDLSVRTEGTFRLRMRLMNVGAPPAPEAGAARVHNDVSPVLAQTFTEQFTVYSAKRFPGVPDTTALSIALGNQGQKLPLRNRHGSNTGKRRRRSGSESDDDSDED